MHGAWLPLRPSEMFQLWGLLSVQQGGVGAVSLGMWGLLCESGYVGPSLSTRTLSIGASDRANPVFSAQHASCARVNPWYDVCVHT